MIVPKYPNFESLPQKLPKILPNNPWVSNEPSPLTVTILETGGYGVPSKSQKSSIWGGVGPTITLKSPGRGALRSTPSRGLQGSQGVLTPPTRFSDKISSHPAGVRGTKIFFSDFRLGNDSTCPTRWNFLDGLIFRSTRAQNVSFWRPFFKVS